MTSGTFERGPGRADISVPSGCPLCAGALDLRVTANSAYSYCAHCHWISRSVVSFGPNSLELAHPPGGVA
jgi:hypothetical protein